MAGQLVGRLKAVDSGSGRWWCALQSEKGRAPIPDAGRQTAVPILAPGGMGSHLGTSQHSFTPSSLETRWKLAALKPVLLGVLMLVARSLKFRKYT